MIAIERQSGRSGWQVDAPGSMTIRDGGFFDGWHWTWLRTAEQLALGIAEVPRFPLAQVARLGCVSDIGVGQPSGGFVTLSAKGGEIIILGLFVDGTCQWLAHANTDVAPDAARMEYALALAYLEVHSSLLFGR